jgi:plasmid stability protein
MGQVLIRDLDDAVIAAYRVAAERNARSLEAELREVLRQCEPRPQAEIADLQDRARALRAMTPDVPQTPAEVLVREDRDGFRHA